MRLLKRAWDKLNSLRDADHGFTTNSPNESRHDLAVLLKTTEDEAFVVAPMI
jgi:hypothetical protein